MVGNNLVVVDVGGETLHPDVCQKFVVIIASER